MTSTDCVWLLTEKRRCSPACECRSVPSAAIGGRRGAVQRAGDHLANGRSHISRNCSSASSRLHCRPHGGRLRATGSRARRVPASQPVLGRTASPATARLIGSVARPGARILDLGCGRNGLHGDDLSCAPGDDGRRRRPGLRRRLPATRWSRIESSDPARTCRLPRGRSTSSRRPGCSSTSTIPGLVFSEVRRVLVTGGRFVFVTPNAWNYNAWMIRASPIAGTPR